MLDWTKDERHYTLIGHEMVEGGKKWFRNVQEELIPVVKEKIIFLANEKQNGNLKYVNIKMKNS